MFKKPEKICENHDYCKLEMTEEGKNILEYIPGEKSVMIPFDIYTDLESILEKISGCENDPKKPSSTKINKYAASGYSLFSHGLFDKLKNNFDCYRGNNCMRNFSIDVREQAENIINYEKAEIVSLTEDERASYRKQKACYFCDKKFSTNDEDKKYHKIRDYCYYTGRYSGASHVMCSKKFKIPKEIPIVFHNGSKYDYHFIIKELAKEFKGQFECLGENAEKYITFSVSIVKELGDGNSIIYKIKFIDSFRFMSTLLSNLVNSLSDGMHDIKCKNCNSCLDYMKFDDNKLISRCFECKTNYNNDFNNELLNRFSSLHDFCNKDINKFMLLLRKGFYPCEYIDSWERFNETSLPDKEYFYSNLNMVNITDTDYRHAKNIFSKFNIKNLGEYHDLYV